MTKREKVAFNFDAASAISQGRREYQEDALATDFSNGTELSFVVLSDGMGGHAAGDVASKIIVTEMFRKLTFMRAEMENSNTCISDTLRKSAMQANEKLKDHVNAHPDTKGMGATLVSTVIVRGKLYWISIGDSPLFLFRDNALIQLNEDHSMSNTIDIMVQTGLISVEEGENHPERNVLTSVLFGEPIPEIDCPSKPMQLQAGDILIVASDGLQFLSNAEIENLLCDHPFSKSCDIADGLMKALKDQNDPDLDNVSMSVIQLKLSKANAMGLRHEYQKKPSETERASLVRKMFKSLGTDPQIPGPGHE